MSLKPSEKRELAAQKKAAEEAAELDFAENEKDNLPKRREGVIQSNVKLITFLICLALFLVFLGPWSIFRISDCIDRQDEGVFDKQTITLDYVRGLSEKGDGIVWKDFSNFNYVNASYEYRDKNGNKKTYIKREYYLDGDTYCVWVGGRSAEGSPEYVYLIDTKNGRSTDIRKSNIDEFIKAAGEN